MVPSLFLWWLPRGCSKSWHICVQRPAHTVKPQILASAKISKYLHLLEQFLSVIEIQRVDAGALCFQSILENNRSQQKCDE